MNECDRVHESISKRSVRVVNFWFRRASCLGGQAFYDDGLIDDSKVGVMLIYFSAGVIIVGCVFIMFDTVCAFIVLVTCSPD
jgi:hypothetical protein